MGHSYAKINNDELTQVTVVPIIRFDDRLSLVGTSHGSIPRYSNRSEPYCYDPAAVTPQSHVSLGRGSAIWMKVSPQVHSSSATNLDTENVGAWTGLYKVKSYDSSGSNYLNYHSHVTSAIPSAGPQN
ncbi:hypothetical protein J6590_087605 [Homalodisca vitripennis]|nr:hypothetical protein J6590_087605 [Homalodisca vitripennis]